MDINIKKLEFSYDDKKILKKISFEGKSGEVLSIVGPNGSGKTTLIKCINRILKHQAGEILLNGKNTLEMTQKEIAEKISYVPQMVNNFYGGSVIDFLILGRKKHINWSVKDEDIKIALNALDKLNILELSERGFSELSGGQQQKILICKSIIEDSDIYLLDEPISFLDIRSQIDTMKLAKSLAANGKTVIMIVHDLNMAMKYSDKVLLLNKGEIVSFGKVKDVLNEKNIQDIYNINVKIQESNIIFDA